MANNIEKHRRARKMSMEKLGLAIGTDASTINKLEKGKIALTQDRLVKIADALGVSIEDLIEDTPSTSTQPTPVRKEGRAMIEVLGAAAGSLLGGTFQLTTDPIEYMELPKALENSRGIYSLYVDGTSMEPMFAHGEKILVSQYRPPIIGKPVIVQEQREKNGPILASVGILRARNANGITLQKLNPAGNVEIKQSYIVAVHHVIGYSELIG